MIGRTVLVGRGIFKIREFITVLLDCLLEIIRLCGLRSRKRRIIKFTVGIDDSNHGEEDSFGEKIRKIFGGVGEEKKER